jgi:NAD(P)-dependent dehydrogenase (short-subunit alcohol dehydrogenase family)
LLVLVNNTGCIKLCEDIRAGGSATKVYPRQVNAASEDAIKKVIDETETYVGPIDLFCSNAGIGTRLAGDTLAGMVDVNQNQWDLIMGVNVYQATYAAKYLAVSVNVWWLIA